MSQQSTMEKPPQEAGKYRVFQYVFNVIGAFVVSAVLSAVVFSLFGEGAGTIYEVRVHTALFLFCFTFIQCHGAIVNTRRDYLRGRWMFPDTPPASTMTANPWGRLLPLAVPTAICGALAAWLGLPALGEGPFTLGTIIMIVALPLALLTSFIIPLMLRKDQQGFAAAISGPSFSPSPAKRYFILEHALPWMFIQGTINLGIGLKQFLWWIHHEEPIGSIDVVLMSTDLGVVFGIVGFFMFISSDTQARADTSLGRVAPRRFSSSYLAGMGVLPTLIMVPLCALVSMALMGAMMFGAFSIVGIEGFTLFSATVLKVLAACLGTMAGCGLGVYWGTRKEAELMEAA